METASRKLAFGASLACAAVVLSACGGGGGGSAPPPPPPGTISFSTNAVTFKAAGPYAQPPSGQIISGTVTGVTSGTVYVKVVGNNTVPNGSNGFFTVTDMTITGDSGQASVAPAIPSSIGAGNFQGSIVVTTCLNDSTCQTGQLAGSPTTIPVYYDIASGVDGDTVTPRVVAANAAGEVILRGSGFTGATSVSFGSTAATSMTVVSDSEIDASYPALPAGTYPVTIDSGSIGDTASLVAVSAPAFAATTVPYPAGVSGTPLGIVYDAQRTALFVLLPGMQPPNVTLLRYAFDGSAWGSATQVSLFDVYQIQLSPDGAHLLALANSLDTASIVELDPVTLAQTNSTTISSSIATYACGFAFADDGNAIVSTASDTGTGFAPGFVFGAFSRAVTPLYQSGGCNPVASGNGAFVALDGATFDASSETVSLQGAQTGAGTSDDFAGDRFLNGNAVENQLGQTLGYVNSSYSVINPAGTRGYALSADPSSCVPILTTFDLTGTPSGSPYEFPVVGTPLAVADSPSGACLSSLEGYLLAISPDGATVFIAGPGAVVVQPL
jgi:hypothetical protein